MTHLVLFAGVVEGRALRHELLRVGAAAAEQIRRARQREHSTIRLPATIHRG